MSEATLSSLVDDNMIMDLMYEVYDPELGINVVDLGLIYGVSIEGDSVTVTMTLTTPGCPLHDVLSDAVETAVRSHVPSIKWVSVELVWEPPWSPDMITEAGLQELGWR
jgi:metal-sulfur cluster biosynthetic enzyme